MVCLLPPIGVVCGVIALALLRGQAAAIERDELVAVTRALSRARAVVVGAGR